MSKQWIWRLIPFHLSHAQSDKVIFGFLQKLCPASGIVKTLVHVRGSPMRTTRRYFVLRRSRFTLDYYLHEASSTLRGSINLKKCVRVSKSVAVSGSPHLPRHTFALHLVDDKVIYFVAKSEEQMHLWADKIAAHMDYISTSKDEGEIDFCCLHTNAY